MEGEVYIKGTTIDIGGKTYAVSNGDTLRNTAVNKPTATAAHSAIPFCYYYSIDTGGISITDGSTWVVIV